jgi:hypothetical protein
MTLMKKADVLVTGAVTALARQMRIPLVMPVDDNSLETWGYTILRPWCGLD